MDTEQASLSHLMISEIPPNFISKFLSNVKKYLANKFFVYHESKQSILCVPFGNSIISNSGSVLSETDINQCSSEEANPRIVRHVINLQKKGYTNVQVKAFDSNVVIFVLCMLTCQMESKVFS